ncbi:MAG: hypothetical protein IKK04_10320 [Bacteroidales bacterium]|nr:hypothetical protein [Bacteroidales bacterium]
MHYDFFDFQHTLSDEERQQLLRDTYEHILKKVSEGSGRNVNKILKYLRESDFYAIPCRHHAFVGGNAWHQLETLVYAYGEEVGQSCDDFDLSTTFSTWRPQWQALMPISVVVASLLHDVGNTHHAKLRFPDRVMRRHGRKSTYVLKDFLHFELMFDENMTIVHHQHKTEQSLRDETPDEETFRMIWEMPLYHQLRCCDTLSILAPMTEDKLMKSLEAIEEHLLPPDYGTLYN